MLVFLLSCLVSWFGLATTSYASSVYVDYALEDQLPPVARIGSQFSWTISQKTFASTANESLKYSAASLPHWLSFDASNLTFHGTPSQDDKGSPLVQLFAKDADDSASSKFTLFVTDQAAPTLQHSVVEQFKLPNPSLSSVFAISDHSALKSSNPALRIPPGWSFSIGFQYDTFTGPGDNVYYAASQADGSPLPDWMVFNPRSITFNGYTPQQENASAPYTVSLALHGSDQEGYSASSCPFDIVVAAHELSLASSSLPTINITASSSFSVSLTSPADFTGVLLDGQQIQPTDIVALEVDISYYPWLKYDTHSRTLSGDPPDDLDNGSLLPVTLTTNINQTLETNVSLAVVPSFFTTADLQPILVNPGQAVNFSLTPFYSSNSGLTLGTGPEADVNLTAAFDPADAVGFLSFNVSTGLLSGTIPSPSGGNNYTHIGVTFTAYSRITHSTSHASLPISLSPSDYAHQQRKGAPGLSAASRARMLLGLKIAFSIIGGMLLMGLFLAGMRRCMRVEDTALKGEEGMKGWSQDEKRWYGIDVDASPAEGGLASIRRAISRSISSIRSPLSPRSPEELPMSPGVMRKSEFLGKIRRTAGRKVSDTVKVVGETCRRVVGSIGPATGTGATRTRKPIISKPVLITHNDEPVRPTDSSPRHPEVTPFEDIDFSQYAPSGMSLSIAGSPSSSTGGRSIPRRRADFAPPNANTKSPLVLTTPPQAYHGHRSSIRRRSVDLESLAESMGSRSALSVRSETGMMTRAERTLSMRSVRSASALSVQSTETRSQTQPTKPRPRLVPFTSSSRVPVPKVPSSYFTGDPDPVPVEPDSPAGEPSEKSARAKRVVSQMAKVFRSASTDRGLREGRGEPEGNKGDALSVGIQYVKALGADDLPARSTSASFSLESSMHGHSASIATSTKTQAVPRMLARTGEQFKFRIPLSFPQTSPLPSSTPSSPPVFEPLEVKLMSGLPLPRFVRTNVDVLSRGEKGKGKERDRERLVEFTGVPTKADVGELNVAVYMKNTEECVGRVIIEVVGRAK